MLNVALLGNPNVGKTTVFNALTGSTQYVGNWPGVTIDKKEGFSAKDIKIIDLPGIYAMDTFSNEEKVAKEFLESDNVDVILNVVDSSNLVRNLYLTTQLMQFNKPIVLLLNMLDVAEAKGINIDYEKLGYELNVKVVPVVAKKGVDNKLLNNILLEEINKEINYKKTFSSEEDTYKYLEDIYNECSKKKENKKESLGEKIDKIVLNPILAYPIFILALFLIFKFTFNWLGQPIADALDVFVADTFTPFVASLIGGTAPWFQSLILDGIIAGVGGIIVFFPIIFVLFLGMSLLEDSGYMSRAAFVMDKIMRKIGLSGKAFIPLIMGFGCSAPAIMATRTLESDKDRKLTALIAPLASCGARLPVYALFASIFFANNQEFVVLGLYLLGIVVAILMGLLFKNTMFNKNEEPFILELPEYKVPMAKNILKHTWEKSKGFLVKAGTLIFAMSVVIWALTNFNFTGFTTDVDKSFLAMLGNIIAPIFAPLGFGTWQSGVSIITGIAAKEVVVGTMEIVYGNLATTLPMVFTSVTAISFLVFVSLYTPCASVLGVMKKEYGTKMMTISIVYQFVLAWVVAYFAKYVASIFVGQVTAIYTVQVLVFAAVLAIAIKIAVNKFNKSESTESKKETVSVH